MANIIPEKGINFSVYLAGEDLLGVAEGNFPSLEAMTSEVKGAGVAGVADTIVLGHFNSLTVTLNWRTTTDAFMKLAAHTTLELDLYEALQYYDAGAGEYEVKPLHIFMKVFCNHTCASMQDRGIKEASQLTEKYMQDNCKMKDKYIKRVEDFFTYTDKNNCKRVYDHIKEIPLKD